VKHWYTWISNTTSITGETLIYRNIKHYKYNWRNIGYSSISMFHQLCMSCFIFVSINVSPAIFVVFDMHAYQYLTSYTCSVWYSCISMLHQLSLISNTTRITDEILIYMHIKHYKYNLCNIDIHEYQTLHAQLVKHWYRGKSNTTSMCLIFLYINISPVIRVVFDIHVYQCFTSDTCTVWYSCISMFHHEYKTRHAQLVKHWYRWISNTTHINGETLIYMNIKQYKYNWWNIDIHEYRTLHVYLVRYCHVYQCLTSYTCSVWYSSISMFHQLCMSCFIFMYINVSPVIFVVFDMHVYQYLI
jgi:hypothetical protein